MHLIGIIFLVIATTNADDEWTGKWFPVDPNKPTTTEIPEVKNNRMDTPDVHCDNAKDNLGIDFDPNNFLHSVEYTCLSQRKYYKPNMTIESLITEYRIPPAYVPLHKCVNESIEYDYKLPTFGTHRPLWAEYGEYQYVPPQRWLHNIEHGSIVMLYHPCANYYQVEKLKMLVKNCLYRHVITPSKRVTSTRPLALLAWGKSIEMSVVDPQVVVNFIKQNALHGHERTSRNGQYNELLRNGAKIVSDINDSILCPNNSF